jgi:hypothetical protein
MTGSKEKYFISTLFQKLNLQKNSLSGSPRTDTPWLSGPYKRSENISSWNLAWKYFFGAYTCLV